MAEIQPLRALHYDPDVVGSLDRVLAPPYDVIDGERRVALASRSTYNVVGIDLPVGDDPYTAAAAALARWRAEGAVVEDGEPALWPLTQSYDAPDGRRLTRSGFLCRVRVEPYGPGRIRPHERTHPGPKEDRLRLTRATRANLSAIFSLYSDLDGRAREALTGALAAGPPFGEATDDDGTLNRIWRVTDEATITSVRAALADAELLIADGHHRYETARTYADEVGGEGNHRFVLMCLVALEDPGMTVFGTHRLVNGLDPARREALGEAIRRDFEVADVSEDELVPRGEGPVRMGYMDAGSARPSMLTLRDQSIADRALAQHAEPYRQLDTAVLEALLLHGALGMSEEDVSHLRGLGYCTDLGQTISLLKEGRYDAAFFMRATPIEQVRAVARAGESMPPKSTYFFPKIPTGLVFNPLT